MEGVCEFSLISVGLEGITLEVSTPGNCVVVAVVVELVEFCLPFGIGEFSCNLQILIESGKQPKVTNYVETREAKNGR